MVQSLAENNSYCEENAEPSVVASSHLGNTPHARASGDSSFRASVIPLQVLVCILWELFIVLESLPQIGPVRWITPVKYRLKP